MKLNSSLDWQDVKTDLQNQAKELELNSQIQALFIISNLNKGIVKLGNEEIHARTTGKHRRRDEMLDAINDSIELLEQHILIERLST